MERVRDFIYSGINSSDNAGEVSKAFFVAHNAVSKEVIFAYTSGDEFVPDDLRGTVDATEVQFLITQTTHGHL